MIVLVRPEAHTEDSPASHRNLQLLTNFLMSWRYTMNWNTFHPVGYRRSVLSTPGIIRTVAFVLLLMVSLHVPEALASDDQNRFSMRGVGLLSCEIYENEREAQSTAYQIFGGWIDGYITGVNQYAPDTFDVLSFESSELIAELLSAHCKTNPQDLVFAVLNSMFIKLQDDRLQIPSPHIDVTIDSRSVRLYEEVLRRIQTRLKEEGHYTGEITGAFGDSEQAAIAAFQTSVGLEPTGFPDQVTLWKLMRSSPESIPQQVGSEP